MSKFNPNFILVGYLIFLVCIESTFAQSPSRAKIDGFRGKVMKVESGKVITDGKATKRVVTRIVKFDRNGNETETVSYQEGRKNEYYQSSKAFSVIKDNIITHRSEYLGGGVQGVVVDLEHKPITFDTLPTKKAASDFTQTLLTFDRENNSITELTFSGEANKSAPYLKSVIYLNKNDLIGEGHFFRSPDQYDGKGVHQYNDKGVETSYTEYDAKGTMTLTFSFSNFVFDSQGNWIRRNVEKFYGSDRNTATKYSEKEFRNIVYYSNKQ